MSALVIGYGSVRRGGRCVLEAGVIRACVPSTIAIVGANGAGKSSLFLLLAGALDGQHADIAIGGRRVTLAFAPQEPSLPAWLYAEEAASLYGSSIDGMVESMPGLRLGRLSGRRIGAMSTGERQALGIALALSRQAAITLLDEPFSALDFQRRVAVLELLGSWRTAHPRGVLVLSSQNAADLAALCDRFLVLRDGRHVFDGTSAELLSSTPGGSATAGPCDPDDPGPPEAGRTDDPGHGAGRIEAALLRLLD